MNDIDKLIAKIKDLFWCDYCNKNEKTVGVYQEEKDLRFANGNKDLKRLTKKHGFKIQLTIK